MIFFLLLIITHIQCHNITVPSGRFTLKISYSTTTDFYIKFSNLTFNFSDSNLFLNNSNQLNISKIKNTSFLKQSSLWISVNLIDRKNNTNNFIRIGRDYLLLSNVVYELKTLDYELIKYLRFENSIEIDPEVKLLNYKIYLNSLVRDYSVKIYGHNRQIIDDIPSTKLILPPKFKNLYEIMRNRGPILDTDDFEAIKFSLETPGCLLYHQNPIRINFKFESINFDGHPFLMEIWSKGSQSPLQDNENNYGLYKIIDGDLMISFYNQNESEIIKMGNLTSDDLGWFSPDIYQVFKFINLNSHKPLILIRSLYETKMDYEFNQFKQIVLYEFYTQTCKRKLENCCEYTGLVCGWKLSENSNCTSLMYEREALYLCDSKENTIKFIDKCEDLCHQDNLATRCRRKLYARVDFPNGYVNFYEDSKSLKMNGLVKNVNTSLVIYLRFYSGNDCQRKGDFFQPSFWLEINEFKLNNNSNGMVLVDLNLTNFNIMDNNVYSLLDRLIVIEDSNGVLISCGVVVKTVKNEEFILTTSLVEVISTTSVTTPTTTTIQKGILYAKWLDSKTNRSYVSYDDGQEWAEYNGDVEFAKFTFIKFESDDIIIYDDNRKIYVKLTDTTVMWGNGKSDINWKFGTGYWILKPKIE
ncbi:unnamed protein product [Brachionus calyciflorus]|uniref:Uncharacterized protein n=1 Tax=Brachionus calyciflorus TaxID=104777 RepID=A0A813RIA6_9BILA|nr:unnamed protein product [Brachionus calyciflorus]